MHTIVAVGANLSTADGVPPLETCRRAAAALDGLAGLRRVSVSPFYRSEAWPDPTAPAFVNGAVLLEGEAEPDSVLAALHETEARAGRVRSVPNAPRPLDLDLIAMGSLVVRSATLVLPHPRAHERAFVMVPVADIAPGWVHPVLGRSAAQIAAGLDRTGLRRIGADEAS